ncbi:DUF3817 domain-containing protein [Thermoleophilia bacterium SCSIO 60948]|nr:DUF3817 domain-containing protein [Thermoleophilia bacterium SCSIO 60948]
MSPGRAFGVGRGVGVNVSLKTFRIVALTEATTFLLLLVLGTAVDQLFGERLGVTVLGPIHGLLFVAYVLIALGIREREGWTSKQTVTILLGAVLPFGGYVVDRWLVRRESELPAT